MAKGGAKAGDIVLALKKDKSLGDEGYALNIGRTVQVDAATARGAFWATRTLLQLSEQSDDRSLPCGQTTDVPEYRLRGFMIDCGRKYIPMGYLRNLTKVMAYYKMNTLHIQPYKMRLDQIERSAGRLEDSIAQQTILDFFLNL